jgi:hypothetical protein
MTQAVTPTKLHPGGELMIEGSVPTVVSVLARDLQAACKGMDDVLRELDLAQDDMGSRARLRFRSYRRSPRE